MKKLKKILQIICIIMFVCFNYNIQVFATETKLRGSIVTVDKQYTQNLYEEVKQLNKTSEVLSSWKNDIAISEIVLSTKKEKLTNVRVTTKNLVSGDNIIGKENITARFITSTKAYSGEYLGYGDKNRLIPQANDDNRKESNDILENNATIDIEANKLQPILLEFKTDRNTVAGMYTTTIEITADNLEQPLVFNYTLNVADAILEDSSTFKNTFDIELWQYPYSSAEYYNVEPFSNEHFNILKQHMNLYKKIGGHAITTTISEDAWNAQTYSKNAVHYPSMIRWSKQVDGSFTYDFTAFDKWVQFNKDLGIGDKIVLYSIAPWHNSFTYYEGNDLKFERFTPGSTRYTQVWRSFLQTLVNHLEEKGWFDEAYIGIDERGFNKAAFDLIDSVKNIHDKSLKTAGAMDGFVNKKALALRVSDLNVGDTAAAQHPEEFKKLVKERKQLGLKTTLYSCTEHEPGNFSLSQPVESYWTIINSGKNTDGFLRWAYDAWVKNPLEDATHNAFEPGDSFLIYPDKNNATNPQVKESVRLVKFYEGLRDVNKLRKIELEVPSLKTEINKLYNKITTNPTTRRTYLTDAETTKLINEMSTFKTDLDALTQKYINLKNSGTNTIESLRITVDSPTLEIGQTKTLSVIFQPENVLNMNVTWTSSNPDFEIDSEGNVTANSLGQTTITAVSSLDNTKQATIVLKSVQKVIADEFKVAYYSFDDETATDRWKQRNGTVENAIFKDGKVAKALYIDSEDDQVILPENDVLADDSAWTISYWIQPSEALTQRTSVLMDKEKDYSFDLKLANNRSSGFHVGKKSGDVLTFKYDFQPNNWYHVTWTQSKTEGLSMYVNGKKIETNNWTKKHVTKAPIDIIGGTGFRGYIDELKIYNKVLTTTEINSDLLLKGINGVETAKVINTEEKYQIEASLISDIENDRLIYESSNKQVACVDENGLVTPVNKGEAAITIKNTDNTYVKTINISVVKNLIIKNTLPTYRIATKHVTDIEKSPGGERQYLGQPDMIRTESGRLITAYPKGHGKGPIIMKYSDDNGETWIEKTDLPTSWAGSQETPTLYKLILANNKERLYMITALPGWGVDNNNNRYGWNTSYSDDGGNTWSEYKHFYPTRAYDKQNNDAIVAMASLVQLKDENGNKIPKWMGVYHNYSYVNFKTYLTFDEDGNEVWSEPEPLLKGYRELEALYKICEVGIFRSPDGNRLVALARSQSHNNPATLFYSDDEGNTWSKPMDLPGSLAGERHKAAYDPISNRLLITFREIRYDLNNNNKFDGNNDWKAGEWVAWIGTYEDLINQNEGQYRILLAEDFANNAKSGDTGYAGVVVLDDGTFILDSYGHFDEKFSMSWKGGVTTDLAYIKQAKFKLGEIESSENLVDYTKLNAKISEVNALDQSQYTKKSFALLAKKRAEIETKVNNHELQQLEVDKYIQELNTCVSQLVNKEDYSNLLTVSDVNRISVLTDVDTLKTMLLTPEEVENEIMKNIKLVITKRQASELNLKLEDYKIIEAYDIQLINTETQEVISELNHALKLKLRLENAGSDYVLLREHNGEISQLPIEIENNLDVVFESDKFSTYVIVKKTDISDESSAKEPTVEISKDTDKKVTEETNSKEVDKEVVEETDNKKADKEVMEEANNKVENKEVLQKTNKEEKSEISKEVTNEKVVQKQPLKNSASMKSKVTTNQSSIYESVTYLIIAVIILNYLRKRK